MQAYHQAAVTVSLDGAIDMFAAEALKQQLACAETADEAIIDLSRVTFAGTTLLNALLGLRRRMRTHGGSGVIRLIGSSPEIRRVLTITNLDRIFEVC